jgi:hypothetical protein
MDTEIEEPNTLPRWVTIPVGLVLFPFALLCGAGSLDILVAPKVPPSAFTISIGSVLLAGSVWVSTLALRLIFIRPSQSKRLVSPIGLRVIGLIFAAIPITSVILGTFWEKPFVHSVMTIAYFGGVFQLFRLAKIRATKANEIRKTKEEPPTEA